jgi:transcriptional regulator with XRE-family HTH domain
VDAAGRDLPDALRHHIGSRLLELREQRLLSQRALAARLGISQPALSKLEAGRSAPSLATLLRLLTVYDMDSVESLLGPMPSRQLADAAFRADTGAEPRRSRQF